MDMHHSRGEIMVKHMLFWNDFCYNALEYFEEELQGAFS